MGDRPFQDKVYCMGITRTSQKWTSCSQSYHRWARRVREMVGNSDLYRFAFSQTSLRGKRRMLTQNNVIQ